MEPLAVWDVNEPSWWTPQRDARSAWLREHGVPVDYTWRTEFYVVDAPFVRFFAYHQDDQGRRHWNDAHDPGREHDHALCGPAKRPPCDLLLDELPPVDLLGSHA